MCGPSVAHSRQVVGAVTRNGHATQTMPTCCEPAAAGSKDGTEAPADEWFRLVRGFQESVPKIRERSRQLGIGAENGITPEQSRVRSKRVSSTSPPGALGDTRGRHVQHDAAIGLGFLIAPGADDRSTK